MYMQLYIVHVAAINKKRGQGFEKEQEEDYGMFWIQESEELIMYLYYNLKTEIRNITK